MILLVRFAIVAWFALAFITKAEGACPIGYHEELNIYHGDTYGDGSNCVANKTPTREARPADSQPTSVAPVQTPQTSLLTPVRSYLKNDQIPPAGVAAYGIVAFRARPTAANRERLLMACSAYVSYLPRQESIPASIPRSDYMLTVWPLDAPDAEAARQDECNYVIDHYDLFAADSAIADAEKQGAHFGAEGPFLIGWSPSNTRGVPDKVVLVVDMSPFGSQDSFDRAFQFWKEKIIQDPLLWRHGFTVEGMRLAVRDFVDHFGPAILASVNVWKK